MNPWEQFVDYFELGLKGLSDVYSFAGGHRWALAIITLTLIVRSLLLPLAIKQIRSMREQQRLGPEMQRIRQKFKNDRQKLTEEMMALYRREGVNPYAACLPMVAQAPVFIAMYYAIRGLTSVPGEVAKQLEPVAKDMGITVLELAQRRDIVPDMPFLGLADLAHPANSSFGGWLLIALMTLAQLVSTRQLNPGTTEQQQRLQLLMPFMFIFLFMSFPAGLVLYWATQAVYQLVQQIFMTRDMRTTSWWRAALPERWSGNGKPPTTRRRSKPAPPAAKPRAQASTSAPAATAVAPAPLVSGPESLDDVMAQRILADKRRRRRKRKKKRRR